MFTSPNYVNICHGRAKQLPSGKNRYLLKCQQSVPGALYGKRKSTDLQLSLCPQVVVADWELHEWRRRRMGRVLQSQQHVKSSPAWLGSKHTTLILPPIQRRDFPPILCGLLECLKMSFSWGWRATRERKNRGIGGEGRAVAGEIRGRSRGGICALCLLLLLERRWKRHNDDLSVSARKKRETSQQLRGVNALIMCVVLGSARGDLLNSKRGSGEGEEGEMRGMEGN